MNYTKTGLLRQTRSKGKVTKSRAETFNKWGDRLGLAITITIAVISIIAAWR